MVEVIELVPKDPNYLKRSPAISPCFNYLVYFSGTGVGTEQYYKDFVICKKQDGQWVQTFRIKDKIVGSGINNYFIKEQGKPYGITQTNQRGNTHILKANLQTGQIQNITSKFANHTFKITNVHNGVILGTVSTCNFNTFFYVIQNTVKIIQPQHRQQFIQVEYNEPIHSILISAKQEDIFPEYKYRTNCRPLVVLPHGGPQNSFSLAITCHRYMLLKMGYYLLLPNFSGSTGYGKQFLQACLGKIGQKDADQIIEVLQKVLKNNQNIDRSNVHTYGRSYGGYLSAIFASRYSKHFKSATVISGVLNICAELWLSDLPLWCTVQSLRKNSLHGLKISDYQTMLLKSPISQPMKIPILQIVGGQDQIDPWRSAIMLDTITKSNGVPITTYVYDKSGHPVEDSVQTIIDATIKSILFLEQCSKAEKKEYKGEKL